LFSVMTILYLDIHISERVIEMHANI